MINFECIRYRNFLSYGNRFTEINLNKTSTTLIVGSNGSGKSTLLDALTFALFNKPFRKVKKGQLVNSVNGRDCLVEVEFTIGKRKYKVVRGIKPNIFEVYCNGELLNQDSTNRDYQKNLEEQILKMNYKTFTQVVILGSSTFVPFMQLSAADRRSIIEDLLDIQIFTMMNMILKQQLIDLRERTVNLDADFRIVSESIKLQNNYIDNLKRDRKKLIKKDKKKVRECQQRIDDFNEKIALLEQQIEKRQSKLPDMKKIARDYNETISARSGLQSSINRKQRRMQTINENDQCPTCMQSLENDTCQQTFDDLKTEVGKLKEQIADLKSKEKRYEELFDVIEDKTNKIQKLVSKKQEIVSDLAATKNYKKRIEQEIKQLENEDCKNLSEEENKLNDLMMHQHEVREEKDGIVDKKHYMDIVGLLLKDSGIKTKIISQYLPIMNQTINKYLNMLDFSISFELDESFDERIKSRHRDDYSYNSFSEGEKQRIDLALLFTWRDIAKMRNSANTNLLILDEVFDSSLDSAGTEEFMKLLETLTKSTNTFIISHHGDALYDKFNGCLHFEKKGNFSAMKFEGGINDA